jgi:hypothetical protein
VFSKDRAIRAVYKVTSRPANKGRHDPDNNSNLNSDVRRLILNQTLITGTIIVTIALLFYSISVLTEQRKRTFTMFVLITRTIGVALDITATAFMIVGSKKIPFTFHGILGYTALTGMLVDTILVWRHTRKQARQPVSARLKLYTRLAYLWWVLAYIAGGLIAAFLL